jgi:hypothetical protein
MPEYAVNFFGIVITSTLAKNKKLCYTAPAVWVNHVTLKGIDMNKIVSLVVCSLLLGSLVCFVGCSTSDEVVFAQGGAGATNVKWEYKLVRSTEEELNKLGSEGWELVCVEADRAFFKRKK